MKPTLEDSRAELKSRFPKRCVFQKGVFLSLLICMIVELKNNCLSLELVTFEQFLPRFFLEVSVMPQPP
jgi:hypothetical protein